MFNMISLLLFQLFFLLHAAAQDSSNLTLSFSPATLSTCAANGSSDAITFTTGSIPNELECFNIEDLFGAANTSTSTGSRIYRPPYSSTASFEDISWTLYNTDVYSYQLNYSRIWYQQQDYNSPDQGNDANLQFEVFSGRDCIQTSSSAETVFPVFIWTCQSSASGDCYSAPYNIMSFGISSAADTNKQIRKCWTTSTGKAVRGVSRNTNLVVVIATMALSLILV